MKTLSIEQTDLDACIQEAQRERIVITRNGVPVALIVGVEGLDAEQLELSGSDAFWRMIAERRRQNVIDRADLEDRINGRVAWPSAAPPCPDARWNSIVIESVSS